jgi:hypothetical protein
VWDNFGAESEPVTQQVEVTEPPPPEVVLVFATSVQYPGDFGGPAKADAICQELATAAQLPGTWTAWLSDDDTDAIDRIPEPGPDGNYQLIPFGTNNVGPIVANDLADLTDGSLNVPIERDEYGEDISTQVWTGTQPDGTGTVSNCSNWTNAEDGYPCPTEGDPACGAQGKSIQTDGRWTEEEILNACSSTLSFYCFSTGK